jgi:hypothetical protein
MSVFIWLEGKICGRVGAAQAATSTFRRSFELFLVFYEEERLLGDDI